MIHSLPSRSCDDSIGDWIYALSTCGEDESAEEAAAKCCQGGKPNCNRTTIKYTDPAMQHCQLHKSWEELVGEHFHDETVLVTGGLGKLMEENRFEVWLCYRDHECSTAENYMCWIYDEVQHRWLPWATNFDLELYKVENTVMFHVSDSQMAYDQGVSYCASSGMELASIYTPAELRAARKSIFDQGISKAITSAYSDGTGWKWRGDDTYWADDEFPLNTGDVQDQRAGLADHVYSLHAAGDSCVWDADMRSEEHEVLCRYVADSTRSLDEHKRKSRQVGRV